MRRFVQFRLGCNGMSIATGCFAGAVHVDRAQRVCLSGDLGDERHLIFERAALAKEALLYSLAMHIFTQAALIA